VHRLKVLSAVIDVLLLGACVTSVVLTTVADVPAQAGVAAPAGVSASAGVSAQAGVALAAASVPATAEAGAAAVPAPPRGWATVFGDDFAGRAGAAPAAANWFYDIGSGYGTGEIERTTSSTRNVYLDGHGHLVLKAIRGGSTWTSARIESTRDDFTAPAGGELEMTASIEQPGPAHGLGYWPAFWALGAPMRTGGGWPTSGEIDMMEDVNALNQASQTLHDAAGSSGHPLIACRGTRCESGFHTYSVIVNRVSTRAESLSFIIDGRVEDTITEAQVGVTAWREAIDHGFFIIFDLAMGGNYPDGECNCTTPTAATTSGASMSVAYVAVYERGGNSTPRARAIQAGEVKGDHGDCLANEGALNTEGNPMDLQACAPSAGQYSAGQLWSADSDRTIRVQGGCLDVAGGATSRGTFVDWYPCNGTAAQAWIRESNGELVNALSRLCLTDPRGDTADRLDIEACTGSAQQRWKWTAA
jgi:beta-glucanase (GH16 family)